MTARGGDDDRFEALTSRTTVLDRLCEGPAHKRDLVDDLDVSRSTIGRALDDLQAAGLVEETDDGFVATLGGRFALERYAGFRDALADFAAAEEALAPLPVDSSLAEAVAVGAESMLATEPMPYRPLETVQERIVEATDYRAFLPVLDDPRHVRLLYEHVVTDGRPAELVVSPSVFETLREEFPRRTAAMADCDGFRLLVAEELPPYGLVTLDGGDRVTVVVLVFTDSGSVHGVLTNETGEAAEWARDRHESMLDAASDRTDDLQADADGGSVAGRGTPANHSLSIALEREGFVQLDVSYFRDARVADPVTAWRVGLSLAEVHTGYAVDRRRAHGSAGAADGDRERESLVDHVENRLAAGTDCAVVGLPGAGKSTLCKQVACAWYAADRGPVLYREQGRGRSFTSVAELCRWVEDAEGHALLVVEDAARPATSAVVTALDRFGERDDVSVLLDSRESEWLDPPADVTVPDVDLVHVPPLDERDCERLVDRFERTLGEQVEVPADRLWADVRTKVEGDDAVASGMVLLMHRLATYADPLATEETTLEAETATVAASLADDGTALRVGVLANALNAAGVGVTRDALCSVAEPDGFEAVEAAIEQLEGRVLFADGDGYRTVHESWSVTFLAQLREVLGTERAAEVFGDAVSAYLGLADDPGRRENAISQLGEGATVAAIEADPGRWADETVEQFADLARSWPKVAPLYGDGEADTITLPAACSAAVERRWPVWLGEAFVDGGYYDRAGRAYERLGGSPQADAERALGRAGVALGRGAYETAAEHAKTCLDLLDGQDGDGSGDTDEAVRQARARIALGKATMQLGNHDRADEQFRAAEELLAAVGERELLSSARSYRGRVAMRQGEFDRAGDSFEESLAIARECGDRKGEANMLNNLGETARYLGEFDRARERHEEALAIRRDRGNREGVGHSLGNLGIIAAVRGNYDRAREYFEGSLAVKREVGDRQGEANTLNNLGNVARREGEYDRASEQFEASLAIKRDLGDRKGVASTLDNLGELAVLRGAYEQCREYVEESLAISREMGDRQREAAILGLRGDVERRCGEFEAAEESLDRARTLAREVGDTEKRAQYLFLLGELARMRREFATARQYYDRATALAKDGGERLDQGRITLGRGRLAFDLDAPDRARERARDARETFAALGADPWVARSERLLGRAGAATGDPDTARDHLTDALDTFQDVDATVDELSTLLALVEIGEPGNEETAEWRDRLTTVVERVPDAAVERHRDRLEECRE